ncbi:MAG: hypothetical protein GF398_14060 [Chitinivibrionales bacterium]|nr:hypothetical protein [Chitinivibrionales bacterium]
MKRISITLQVLTIATFQSAFARNIDSLAVDNIDFQMLEEPVNPRIIAMGGAGTALPGRGFAFYGPAQINLYPTSYLSADYGRWPQADASRSHIETVLRLPTWSLGIDFRTFSIDDIFPAGEQGVEWNNPASDQQSFLALTVGRRINRLSIGATLKGMQHKLFHFTSYGLGGDIGAAYAVVPQKLFAGAAMLNLGSTTPMLDEKKTLGEGGDLPMTGRLGVAWIDTIGTVAYALSVDAVVREVNKQVTLPIGIEVTPIPALSLRIGKHGLHPTQMLSMGFGINAVPLKLDVSFRIPRLVDDVELRWLASLTYDLVTPAPASKEESTE